MMNTIHPTALIDPSAELGEGNYIGPFCIIGPHVKMGNHNRLEAHVAVGTAAEHRDYFLQEPGQVTIGNNCILREFVTVNGGTLGATELSDNVSMLRGSHVGHDAIIGPRVNLSCNVMVGGHTVIGEGANIGLATTIHQMRVIGAYVMVGMSSTVTRNILPFVVAFGSPCESQRVNRIGLQRAGLDDTSLKVFEDWFQELRQSDQVPNLAHPFSCHLERYANDVQKFGVASPKMSLKVVRSA